MKHPVSLHTNTFSNELNLLLGLLRSDPCEWDEVMAAAADLDWNLFLELAWHHRVYPNIYSKLKKITLAGMPPQIWRTITQEYQKNTFQMLYLSGEMKNLCEGLAAQGIRSLCLKGPILAFELYGELSLRTSGDLDLLIDMKDLQRTEDLLIELGYVKDDYIHTILNDWKWRHHHITFFHPAKEIKVEIHWRLHPGPAREPGFPELWDRRTTSSMTDFPIYCLGKEDLFYFLVSHGARHGWSRLRWLVDIDQLAKQQLNWDQLHLRLQKYQTQHVGGQALILAAELLQTPIAAEMEPLTVGRRPRRLAEESLFYIQDMVNLHSEPLPEVVSKYHKRHLFSLMSIQQKIVFLLSVFFPYPEDAETLPLPKNLHVLYFVLRPILWFWRKKHAIS